MTDAALTLRPWLSPRTAWGFRVCERERRMLGGTISFISQRKGTKILVQVPLAHQDSRHLTGQRST